PDRRAGANRNAVLDDRGRMDARRIAATFHQALASKAGRRSRALLMSTCTQLPERRDTYAASTAATVRRHSPALIHGGASPATRAWNEASMRRCASALSQPVPIATAAPPA